MLDHYLSFTSLSLGLVTVLLLTVVLKVHRKSRWHDGQVLLSGGVRAHHLAANPIAGLVILFETLRSFMQDDLSSSLRKCLDNIPGDVGNHHAAISFPGFDDVLITRDALQIKHILANKFTHFGHGPDSARAVSHYLFGKGIFAIDGQEWHESRSMLRPVFDKNRMQYMTTLEDCTGHFTAQLSAGKTVDLNNLLRLWSLDITMRVLVGNSSIIKDYPSNRISDELVKANFHLAIRSLFYPFNRHTPDYWYKRSVRRIEDDLEPIISRALSMPDDERQNVSKKDENFSLMHSITRYTMDRVKIRDEFKCALVAGRDTTAATMSWAFYHLATCPQAWQQVRGEVLDVVGSSESPTYDMLNKMSYTNHVIQETLRLYPAVPVLERVALQTTTLPGASGEADISIVKGTKIMLLLGLMQERKDLYPPISDKFADPALFSPERWEHWTPKPENYIPFIAGPRACLGRDFAMRSMVYCLARVAQRFERIEYRGEKWQKNRIQVVGTPSKPVSVVFFDPVEANEEAAAISCMLSW